MVGRGWAHLGVREVNHVGVPVGVAVLAEHRGIAGHLDHVAITLDVGQIKGFSQRRFHIGALHVGRGGPLAEVHLGALSVVVVVVVAVVHEPARRLVVVLVDHILQVGVATGKIPALLVVGTRRMERSDGAADLDVGIFGADSAGNHRVALLEDGADDVLVAYTYIFKVEGGGMAGIGAHLGPLRRGGVAVGPVNEVEQFLDVGGHLVHRYAALLSADTLGVGGRVLAGHAGCQYGQRFGTDVLAELEVLIEAQSARLVVAPDVEVGLAVLQRADGLVPVVYVLQSLTVGHATAGESHELRFQVGNHLCQVAAQAVLAVHKGLLREERNHVDTHVGRLQRHDGQPGFGIATLGGEHGGIPCPSTGRRLQFTLGQHSTILADELNHKVLLLTAAQYVHREVVLLTLLHGDAVPALVPEGVFRPQQGVVRIVLAERVLGGNLYGARRVPGRRCVPFAAVLAVVFEVAVLDELSVEAAIGSIADVLEEDADEVGADGLLP